MTQRRRFSYAEIFAMLEAAREKEYRSDPERAECMAETMERCLYLLLRTLADGEEATGGKDG